MLSKCRWGPACRLTCLIHHQQCFLLDWDPVHLPIVGILLRTSADRLQIKCILICESGGANEGGGDDGLADVGVGTEHLVDAQVSVEMAHIILLVSPSGVTTCNFICADSSYSRRNPTSLNPYQVQPQIVDMYLCTGQVNHEHGKDMARCLEVYGGMVLDVDHSVIYIANVFPCPWSKLDIGHCDSDATCSKVPTNAFLGEGISSAHVRDIADMGRDAKGSSPQDVLVSPLLGEELGNNRHELLTGFARLWVIGKYDRAKTSNGSTRSHVGCKRFSVSIMSDAFGTGARIGCVIRDPTFHGVL